MTDLHPLTLGDMPDEQFDRIISELAEKALGRQIRSQNSVQGQESASAAQEMASPQSA